VPPWWLPVGLATMTFGDRAERGGIDSGKPTRGPRVPSASGGRSVDTTMGPRGRQQKSGRKAPRRRVTHRKERKDRKRRSGGCSADPSGNRQVNGLERKVDVPLIGKDA